MIYTVVWTPDALDQLAALWPQAADRDAVTRAAQRIDHLLRHDPDTRGVDFYGDRLLVEPPLHVVYSVHRDDRLVKVQQVW
jgi:plasmid stabilization system protein ParE